MIRIKIGILAARNGYKTAYALQKALDISPTMASRLYRGKFDKIGIGTIDKLCDLFHCQPDAFLEYDYTHKKLAKAIQLSNTELSKKDTQSSNKATQSSNKATQTGNTQSSKIDTQSSNTQSSKIDTQSSNTELRNESDNDRLLSTFEVAERLGVSRKSVNDYIIDGKLPAVKGKQNHNFVRLSDVLIYESVHGAKD
jgi:DNA-binding Xre family transcriptional regulator